MNTTMTRGYATIKKTRGTKHRKKYQKNVWALKFTLTTTKAHLCLPLAVLRHTVACANITDAEEWSLWRSTSHLSQLHIIGGKNKTPWIIQDCVLLEREGARQRDRQMEERDREKRKYLSYHHAFTCGFQSISIIALHIE